VRKIDYDRRPARVVFLLVDTRTGNRVTIYIVGGSPAASRPLGLNPGLGDRVIAADRGAAHARTWGWPVHLLVGDLDSIPPADAAALAAAGVPVQRVPAEKDDTDLELALEYALAEEMQSIVICGVLGGRADHLLANVLLLARPDLAGRDIVLADGPETIRLLVAPGPDGAPADLALTGASGDLLTLLPLGADAEGVSAAGLYYPLADERLYEGQARGVSNVFAGPHARVTLRRGRLLIIQTAAQRPR
jgi:thiamine pyrophosphokinase